MTHATRIQRALDVAIRYGGTDGDHHKAWVIDQMVRALTGCPFKTKHGVDYQGKPYQFRSLAESVAYRAWVTRRKAGEDGPETYDWNEGIAP